MDAEQGVQAGLRRSAGVPGRGRGSAWVHPGAQSRASGREVSGVRCVYTANCCGNEFNTGYPNMIRVAGAEDLKKAAAVDHVAALYKTGFAAKDTKRAKPIPFHRSNNDFVESNCLMLDCDNSETDEPTQWITPERIKADFPGVTHYIVTSRNNMKAKDGKAPRPKFHVYFPIEIITDVREYSAFKNAMTEKYPYFDFNAKDGARYFFGNPEAAVTYIAGGE